MCWIQGSFPIDQGFEGGESAAFAIDSLIIFPEKLIVCIDLRVQVSGDQQRQAVCIGCIGITLFFGGTCCKRDLNGSSESGQGRSFQEVTTWGGMLFGHGDR